MLSSSAATFRAEADAGNIGINIGVAAPMAFFPFSGWKDGFFGDLHGQGMDKSFTHTCTCAASAGARRSSSSADLKSKF